jgi:hypothetical protein
MLPTTAVLPNVIAPVLAVTFAPLAALAVVTVLVFMAVLVIGLVLEDREVATLARLRAPQPGTGAHTPLPRPERSAA